MRTIDKTFSEMYFIQSTFNRDRVSYLFNDGKWREETMLKTEAEKLMRPDNTTDMKRLGMSVWKVKL